MKPTRVILHCSATPDYSEGSRLFDRFGASDIDIWHKRRNFSKIGYHRVIRRSGVWEVGREYHEQGAHCLGHNGDSIGICLIGTKDFTESQIISLKELSYEIERLFGIGVDNWFLHCEFNQHKTCPNLPKGILRYILRSTM